MADRERPISADELAVTLAVRGDLGPQHDDAVVAEFLDRVGAAIDQRVDERLAAKLSVPGLPADQPAGRSPALGLASIGMGIPITAIVLGTTGGGPAGIVGLLAAWGGIAAVNLAYARRR